MNDAPTEAPTRAQSDAFDLDTFDLDTFDLDAEFAAVRRDLVGFCYRMLGAPGEAEDAVQETLVRAWKAIDRFEGRSSLRSWLHRIAGNVCIDMHRSPQRRARPMDLGPSSRTAEVVLGEPSTEPRWVQPVADERVLDPSGDPAHVAELRESIRLAFVAALQHLPAKQRAALILADVLHWQAAEVAVLLDTTVPAVNSALQRARATMARLRSEPLDPLTDPRHQALLARYCAAFERYDVDELVTLMRDDVVLSMPPWPTWLRGPDELAAWFLGPGIGCRGSRLVPITLNGTGGFASYKPSGPGVWEPWALQVIEVAGEQITAHHNFITFGDPAPFVALGLPAHLGPEG